MTLIDHAERVVSGKIIPMVANTSVFGGAGASFLAWLGGQNAVAWLGILIGIAGLVLNWWHKRAMQRIARGNLELEQARFEYERGRHADPT